MKKMARRKGNFEMRTVARIGNGILLTCGVHWEEIVLGQLLFTVEFGDYVTDEITIGIHQTGEGNWSWADATK